MSHKQLSLTHFNIVDLIQLVAKKSTSKRTCSYLLVNLLVVYALSALAFSSQAYAQIYFEAEPNSTCVTAQDLTAAIIPLQVKGFKTQTSGDAVDFYRFSAPPGTQFPVKLEGDFSKAVPLTAYGIGVFASDCPPFPGATQFTVGSPAELELTVPSDGTFVIGVTACCDLGFTGSGTLEGDYVLSVGSVPPPPTPPAVVGVQTYGATYGELSARWWQWLLSIPAAVNPNLDTTGANCGQGQYDDVWFLAGTFGGTVERSCTIPAGKPIFFPLINTIAFKPGAGETLLDLRRLAADFIGSVVEVGCTIDDVPCFEDSSRFRVRSPSFTVIAPPKGLVPPGKLSVPGNTDPLVSDGYWLLLDPPEPGNHVIHFNATTNANFSLEVTYNLTIP